MIGGNFLGSQGSVSLGTGAGGNLLVGGRNKEIVLQSAGISANAGYNFADGVAALSLTPAY